LRSIGFDVVQCDVLHLPFKDNSIDGAFFSHVIEHIRFSNAVAVLREIKRVVKNKLVVVTPTEHRDFWSPGHITSYDKRKLLIVLKKAGFYVSKCFYDKCFMLGLPDHELFVTIFNVLPFIWLRMNIVAVSTKVR
jgi:ubiquinone/menaquinone biosynthesis C-methylase UbiE